MLEHPARRLRDAAEPLAQHATGSVTVRAALADLGLDRFPGYVGGRAGGLGDAEPGAVVAAFAFFEPGTLTGALTAARQACNRLQLLGVRAVATAASLRRVLAGTPPDRVAEVTETLRATLAPLPAGGSPLFDGLRALPWPPDPYGCAGSAGHWRG